MVLKVPHKTRIESFSIAKLRYKSKLLTAWFDFLADIYTNSFSALREKWLISVMAQCRSAVFFSRSSRLQFYSAEDTGKKVKMRARSFHTRLSGKSESPARAGTTKLSSAPLRSNAPCRMAYDYSAVCPAVCIVLWDKAPQLRVLHCMLLALHQAEIITAVRVSDRKFFAKSSVEDHS